MAALGRPLGASWPLLGRSWVPSGWSWASLGRILALRGSPDLVSRCFLARLGWVWDPFWGRFEHACCEQSLYLRTALIAAENPGARSPAIIFSPSGAAVCAPHMELQDLSACQCHPCPFWASNLASLGLMLAHFWLIKRLSNFIFEKNLKKLQKSMDFGFQNPPKVHPKMN